MVAQIETPQRIARLTPLDDVLARIDALVGPVAPREVGLAAAVGRVLAGDVVVAARPANALALRDGWAVNSSLTQDASPYAPAPLPAAIRIDAGATLPPGSDAVAEIDAVVVRDGCAEAVAAVTAGEGVLPAGADADGATALAREGWSLNATTAGVLAAAQVSRIRHSRAPPARGAGPARRPDHRCGGGLVGACHRGRGRRGARRSGRQ